MSVPLVAVALLLAADRPIDLPHRRSGADQDQVTSGTVPVVVVEDEARVVAPSDLDGPPPLVVAGTAALALLFAVVVLATVRGLGFVRGTGQPGEMTPGGRRGVTRLLLATLTATRPSGGALQSLLSSL